MTDFAGEDRLIVGIDNIAKYLGWTRKTLMKRRKELREAGIIFYMNRGRPPRLNGCAWEKVLKLWTMNKGAKGERL